MLISTARTGPHKNNPVVPIHSSCHSAAAFTVAGDRVTADTAGACCHSKVNPCQGLMADQECLGTTTVIYMPHPVTSTSRQVRYGPTTWVSLNILYMLQCLRTSAWTEQFQGSVGRLRLLELGFGCLLLRPCMPVRMPRQCARSVSIPQSCAGQALACVNAEHSQAPLGHRICSHIQISFMTQTPSFVAYMQPMPAAEVTTEYYIAATVLLHGPSSRLGTVQLCYSWQLAAIKLAHGWPHLRDRPGPVCAARLPLCRSALRTLGGAAAQSAPRDYR